MKFSTSLLRQCWFLAGPTAVGKSELALHLAAHLNAEILSLDSMAIFRGMDIGTAKPDSRQQQMVPHHLIDLIQPDDEFSTAQYLQAAMACCDELLSRGKTPLFVGGTGLYLRALLRGVFEGPPADWKFRTQLSEQAARHGTGWLHRQLQEIDPVSAARLHPNDERRLIRSLEIAHLTGQPASTLQQEIPLPVEERTEHVYWLHPPRDWLADRIDRRVDQMFELGFEQEVRTLLKSAHPPGRTARQALGYRELIEWIEAGPQDAEFRGLEPVTEQIKTHTRQFAKRQETWFRNLEECREVAIDGTETPEELCGRILNLNSTPTD